MYYEISGIPLDLNVAGMLRKELLPEILAHITKTNRTPSAPSKAGDK